jgi:hypothetical protein
MILSTLVDLSVCQVASKISVIWQHGGSDVQGSAWPESPGLGLALGAQAYQAEPWCSAWAWLGLGLAWAKALLGQNKTRP